MDIANSKTLNVNQPEKITNKNVKNQPDKKDPEVKFSDALKDLEKTSDIKKDEDCDSVKNSKQLQENTEHKKSEDEIVLQKKTEKTEKMKEFEAEPENSSDKNLSEDKIAAKPADFADSAINVLNGVLDEFTSLNQKDEILPEAVKLQQIKDDNNKQEENGLIDNNMNIQEPQQEKFAMQTGAEMNFNSNGKPFSEFVNTEKTKGILEKSAKDLAEEKAVMSTMEENIAIANKNMAMSREAAKTRIVENEHGIHKIDKKSNLVVDTVISYDRVIMDKSDVEFFTALVENGVVDLKEIQAPEKSSRVSKTLADLLVKSMNENKPVRIDFDNNISVIIKIDRAGKISADFLPSSQVAEAYLKENLPLLKQRFDDNNIDYNELNQRQRKQDTQDNRKKGRKDE